MTQTMQETVRALAQACDDFSQTIAASIDPALSARLAAGTRPSVAINVRPLAARMLLETDDGEVISAGGLEGADLPRAFDAAVAAFVGLELDRLKPETQSTVAAHLKRGSGRLAVILTPWPFSADLWLYVGRDDPHLLARVTAADGQTH